MDGWLSLMGRNRKLHLHRYLFNLLELLLRRVVHLMRCRMFLLLNLLHK
jgi:hypothetical protein